QAEDGIRDFHVTGVQTCALPIYERRRAEVSDRVRLPRKQRARRTVRRLVRQIPRMLVLIARLLRDGRVPVIDKAIFAAVLAYIVAPVDLMPDFLVGIGFADDLYLLGLALNRLFAGAGGKVLLESWDGDPRDLEL